MSEIRRKIMLSNVISQNDNPWMLDLHLDEQNMYDSVSGFSVNLDSAGVFNSEYNCLQKLTGGSRSHGAATISMVNHPIRNFDLNTFTSTSKYIREFTFVSGNSNNIADIIVCLFPSRDNGTFNIGYWKNSLRSKITYGGYYVYRWVEEYVGPTYYVYLYNSNNELIFSGSRTATWIADSLKNFINQAKIDNYLIILPAPYGVQSSQRFYLKSFKVAVEI